ncbi:hypothetical protein GCM10022421_08960 [Oceanisphaera sediminis]|uniref:Secreted protein n=1 Tax=Oceanisphaera sediminis TaxID=981381 RepID=A0ABP7DHA2_9GAMM
MKTRKKALLVAAESSYGVSPLISTATLMTVSELDSSPYEGDRVERTRLREQFGAQAEVNVAPFATVTATVPLAGSGAAGTAPNFGLLLRACGLAETVSVGTSVAYQPATDDHESFTVWFVEDGQLQQVPGCRGTVELSLTAKEMPTMQFTLTGLYQRPVVHAGPLAQTLTNIVDEIPVNKGNTTEFTVHGHAGCGQSLSINLGNTVGHRHLIGCENVQITDRVATGSVEVEAPDLATKNYFQALESHETVTLGAIGLTHGTTVGNIVQLAAPKTQLSTISRSDSDGIVHYALDLRLIPDVGDDELTITFK